ncbi:MAG: Rne/Rng family ribonuclease [Pseudomonadota bacterium]
MPSKMLIDGSHREETRVVVTKGDRLEDFDFESEHKAQIRGNIYLAKVTRVEPSLQAAFVEYGGNRHGFLAFSEIHPDYYQIPLADRQALLEEEARLAAEEDADDDAEPDEKERRGGRKHRNRRGRGRGRRRFGREKRIPEAEPVAMDAILAALESEAGSDENADGGSKDKTVAAAATNDTPSISEELDEVFGEPRANGDTADETSSAKVEADPAADEHEVVDANDSDDDEDVRPSKRRVSRRHYKIQEVIKRRQIILVQVVKEERGNKGAALTTYLSLAGRFSVLMPNTARGGGISRKISNQADRTRLKATVKELNVPKGMGVILRTAGADQKPTEIVRDYEYLMRLWDNIRDFTLQSTAPALVYEEGNLIKRSIRDLFNPEMSEIAVAGAQAYREAKDFMRMLMPSHAKIVKPWRDSQPILARTGVEEELDALVLPQVTLKSGGYIIINQTEALVAIDVNSGKSTREMSVEETAIATNLEAAEEVARQLRLRDLAGLIVIDFIDMEENRNNRAVEKKLKEALQHDRARIQLGRISSFGLLEMSRQRMRASVLESTMSPCPHCNGTGYVRSVQSVALRAIRAIEEFLQKSAKFDADVKTNAEVALYLLNNKRDTITGLEHRFGARILISAGETPVGEDVVVSKGDFSTLVADPDKAKHISVDFEEDPEVLKADEEAYAAFSAEDSGSDDAEENNGKSNRRRRRRGRKSEKTAENENAEVPAQGSDDDEEDDGKGRNGRGKRRGRGRRGGRNRRGRRNYIPAAEPVGPLADQIAAEEAEMREKTAKLVEEIERDADINEPEQVAMETPEAPEVKIAADAAEEETQEASKSAVNGHDKDVAIESSVTTSEKASSPDAEAEAEPERIRATEDNIDLNVVPIVSSTTETETEQKPKRGWWRRK